MPLTRYVWVKKYPSVQNTNPIPFLTHLRKVVGQEKFSRKGLSQFSSDEPLVSLRLDEISDIPDMTDYLCWRVQLCPNELELSETSNIVLGDISGYDFGNWWALVFEPNLFIELTQQYVYRIVEELTGAESPDSFANISLISNHLIGIHSFAENPLKIPLSCPPAKSEANVGERVKQFLRDFDTAWSAIQAGSPAYYQYKIGWEENAQPSPDMPNPPRADKMSWPLLSRTRYNLNSYNTSAWLDLRLDHFRPSIMIRPTHSGWSAILPFVGYLLLAMQEVALVDLTATPQPYVMPIPFRQGLYLRGEWSYIVETLQRFAHERLWRHGWGRKNLRLYIENSRAWVDRFAQWRVLSSTRPDEKPGSSVGEILIASLSSQEQIVELSAHSSPDPSAFVEFARELLDYAEAQGIQWHPLAERAKEDGLKSSLIEDTSKPSQQKEQGQPMFEQPESQSMSEAIPSEVTSKDLTTKALQDVDAVPKRNRNTKTRRKSKPRRKKIYVPKLKRYRERWKEAWKIICQTCRAFKRKYEAGETENPVPSSSDLIEAIKAKIGWVPGQKTLRRIIIAGKAGKLK